MAKLKKIKNFIHDLFFREIFSQKKYALDIFRLILTKREFKLFDWNSLTCELSSFFDAQGREKRTDLPFSVQLKNSHNRIKLLFLLEHKSWQDPKAMQQMLAYQTGMYERTQDPVIPVFVYQGKDRKWKGPLDFHDYLNWTDDLKKRFGKNVLNFCPKVLNIQDLDMEKDTKGLTSRPVLFTLKHIWRLDEAKVRKLFILGQELSHEEREALVGRAVDYMRRYDRNFSWKMLRAVEIKTIKRKGGRIMTPVLQYSLDEAQEKGVQKGWKKGWKEGVQQGMQQGMQQERQQVVLNMLKSQLDTNLICKVTGLSTAEINKLKNGS